MVLVGSSYMTYTMLYHSFLTIASLSTFPYLAKIVINVCRSISGGTFVAFTVRSASADLSDLIVLLMCDLSNREKPMRMHGSELWMDVDWFSKFKASSSLVRYTKRCCFPRYLPSRTLV